MLYARVLILDESGAVAVTALIVLASCLPGHAKLDGDLRPSDAEADGVVDERRKLRLCLLLRNPGSPDPFQHLRTRHPGNLQRLTGQFRWCWPPVRLRLPDPRA